MTDGCDCKVLCSMGPTCPGGILSGLAGSGCDASRGVSVPPVVQEALEDLFGDAVPVPIDPVGGDPHNVHLKPSRRKRADIVADRIAAGRHPLTNGPLHPDASRDRDNTSSGDDPFTCGSCIHRATVGHHTRSYPKCLIPTPGAPLEPPADTLWRKGLTDAEERVRQSRWAAWWAARYPRVSHSDATDVRAWWPACPAYQPKAD